MFVHFQTRTSSGCRSRYGWTGWRILSQVACSRRLILANLPFVYKWVALMPDTHQGYGMPIGGVIATEDIIIPNAVGVDIGCGMAFVETNIH